MTPKESKAQRFEEIKKRVLDQRAKRESVDSKVVNIPQNNIPAPSNPFGGDTVLQFPSTPIPVSISDKNLLPQPLVVTPIGAVQESTARDIVGTLDLVNDSLVEGLVDVATDTNQLKMIKSIDNGFDKLSQTLPFISGGSSAGILDESQLQMFGDVGDSIIQERKGFFGVLKDNFNYLRNTLAAILPFIGTVRDNIKTIGFRLLTFNQKQTEYLQSINDENRKQNGSLSRLVDFFKQAFSPQSGTFKPLDGEQFRKEMRRISGDFEEFFYKNKNGDIRKSVADGGLKMSVGKNIKMKGLEAYEAIFAGTKFNENDSKLKKTAMGAVGIFSFFTTIGAFFAGMSTKLLAPLFGFIANGLPAGVTKGIWTALSFFTGLTGFMTVIGTYLAAAMAWSIIKDPSYIGKYMEAFGNVWEQNIGPTLKWLADEVVPPISMAFATLAVILEKVTDGVGRFMNDMAIYAIGTALPETLTTISDAFHLISDTTWTFAQGILDIGSRIAGIFGVGEYADEGILGNILGLFTSVSNTVTSTIDMFLSRFISLLNLDKLLGLNLSGSEGEGGQTFFGIWKNFFTSTLPNFVGDVMSTAGAWLQENNPFPIIKTKIQGFVDGIISLIPSWDEIKIWLRKNVPEPAWGFLGIDSARIGNDSGRGLPSFHDFKTEMGVDLLPSGLPKQEPSNIGVGPDGKNGMEGLYEKFLEEERAKGNVQPIVQIIAPNNSSTNNTSISGGGGKVASARPSTAPNLNPWDMELYRISAYG